MQGTEIQNRGLAFGLCLNLESVAANPGLAPDLRVLLTNTLVGDSVICQGIEFLLPKCETWIKLGSNPALAYVGFWEVNQQMRANSFK